MNKVIFHGEVIAKQIEQLPKECTKVNTIANYYVVGESETHGNDHRVAVKEREVEFYERNGVLYMKNLSETEIFCPNDDKHTAIKMPAGFWEFGHAQEYDYIEQESRRVAD